MSKAEELADGLDAVPENGADPDLIQGSAEELRRLSAINAELLEALKLADECMSGSTDKMLLIRASKSVRAAIAKAQGERP